MRQTLYGVLSQDKCSQKRSLRGIWVRTGAPVGGHVVPGHPALSICWVLILSVTKI